MAGPWQLSLLAQTQWLRQLQQSGHRMGFNNVNTENSIRFSIPDFDSP